MDYEAITTAYYEAWLGEQGCLSDADDVRFIYSAERNVQQPGYPSIINLYAWLQPNKIIVSYGDAAQSDIDRVRDTLFASRRVSDVVEALKSIYHCSIRRSVKYKFEDLQETANHGARMLSADHYGDYEAFFRACNPNTKNIEWLAEYFGEIARVGHCAGVYEDGVLVSCTDAPTMPYMMDKVQEIGINTLPDYRGRGYAAASCIKAAENILAGGKVPQWSTSIDNIASQKLAERVGFVKMADVLTLTMTRENEIRKITPTGTHPEGL